MTRMRVSVRARMTALYGGLFLLGGGMLIGLTYVLVTQFLPTPFDQLRHATGSFSITASTGSSPTVVPVPRPPANSGTGQHAGNAEFVGVLTDYRSAMIRTVVDQSAFALLIAATVAVVIGWLAAGRILRPIKVLTVTARQLGAENLDQRLAISGPRDELKEMADTFDEMLDRLAASFDSQRRFIANASHELRTPLAIQRTLVEVAMAGPNATPELRKLGKQLLTTNHRNERLVEGLLTLAHSERGLDSKRPVRLDQAAATALESVHELATERSVDLRAHLAPSTVSGDPVLLERLIINLLQNAVRYNQPGGWVRVDVARHPTVVIENTGPPIPQEAILGLFEPFRRLSTERTRETDGSGLGLSIVRAIVKAHGGSVTARPGRAGGLLVTIDLDEKRVDRQRRTAVVAPA